MKLLPMVGATEWDQTWPTKGHLDGFAQILGDFINAIDPGCVKTRCTM
jgi:hypothetical protein